MPQHRAAGWGLLVFVCLAAGGCRAPVLAVDDVLVPRGAAGRLSASLAHQPILGMCNAIEDAAVAFFLAGRPAGQAVTNRDGLARLSAAPPRELEHYEARVLARGRELTGMGRIFTWDPHRPVIAVDIDHTIADTQRRELIGSTASDPSTPIPLAAPTLRELGQRFQILYLTSRPRFLLDKTRHWLRDHGFPEGPVFTAAGLFEMFGSRAYKQAKLAELRRAWPNLLIGIGDRASDAAAYQANGMLAINIGLEPSARLSAGTVRLRDWGDVREFFAEHYEHAGLAALRDGASVKATR